MIFVPPHFYINWVKRALNRMSGPALSLNGVADDGYRTAIMSLQADKSMSVTGMVDKATQDQLIKINYSSPEYAGWVRGVLRVTNPQPMLGGGSTLDSTDKVEIMRFQENLGNRPDGKLTIDGWIGPQTEMIMWELLPPPRIDFPPSHVRGERQGDQPKVDEVKAVVFYMLGRTPGDWSTTKLGITLLQLGIAVYGGATGTAIGMPLNPWMLSDAISRGNRTLAALEYYKGRAYAFMDQAARFARSSGLDDPDLYEDGRESFGEFKKGYKRMTDHFALVHRSITNTNLDKALAKFGNCKDQRRVLRNIYDGMIEVYRTDEPLANSQTFIMTRWCEFDYPDIKVRCSNKRPNPIR